MAELKMENSEHRWIEAALRESEERYRRLVESITDYIYTVKVENGSAVSTTHGQDVLPLRDIHLSIFRYIPIIGTILYVRMTERRCLSRLERYFQARLFNLLSTVSSNKFNPNIIIFE